MERGLTSRSMMSRSWIWRGESSWSLTTQNAQERIRSRRAECGRSTASAVQAELGERDVHVWATGLDHNPAVVDSCRRLLAPDEIARARRFRFRRDRDRYVVGRG